MAIKKSQLYKHLWEACNALRGGMDASEYKDYILVLLFVRYLTDKYDGKDDIVQIPQGGSFKDLVALKGKPNIGEGIDIVLSKLATENALNGVIDRVSFNDEDKLGKGKEMVDRLTKLIAIFENPELDFSNNNAGGDDLLGDAYEYLIGNFAVESGKSKGSFYTPAEVSRIMAKVIKANESTSPQDTVYDPTCGSGSLLLKISDEAPNITIYGQEKDNTTKSLAILNMWMHGRPTADIKGGQSTLAVPLFTEQNGSLKTFDYVVANPPFSQKNWTDGFNPSDDQYERFDGFGIPPEKNGDYAFLLHILKSLKPGKGRGAVILPHGVLFRGGAEEAIRKNIIRFIKGIIGLPSNLFYGTGIPACIIVLDKPSMENHKGIFFIDASKDYIKDGAKNRLREQDIRKITDTFLNQIEIPHYSRFVSDDEIAANGFNLNIPRYIAKQSDEIIQNIDAHLNGGISDADIDELNQYWSVCPTLKSDLFSGDRTGFSKMKTNDVVETIANNSEFTNFRQNIHDMFNDWILSVESKLKGLCTDDNPKDLIQELGSSVLAKFDKSVLIEKYDVYGILRNYWNETMADDCYLIKSDGWQDAGRLLVRLQKETKKKDKSVVTKDVAGLCGLEGALIPTELVITEYFDDDNQKLIGFKEKLSVIQSEKISMIEEESGDDGLLTEVIKNKKTDDDDDSSKDDKEVKITVDTKALKKRLKEKIDEDEKMCLTKYSNLLDQEKQIKDSIKKIEASLEKQIMEKYVNLTLDEIKHLVVDVKWSATLESNLDDLIEKQKTNLTNSVQQLADRYSETLSEIESKANGLEQKVKQHLKNMGF